VVPFCVFSKVGTALGSEIARLAPTPRPRAPVAAGRTASAAAMDEVPGMTQVLGGERIPLDGASVLKYATTEQGEGPRKCYGDIESSFGGIYEGFIELAGELARDEGFRGELDQLKQALPKLVAAQSANKARLEAIRSFADSYQCSTEKTDFQEALHAPIAAALRRPNIGNDPDGAVARFERAIEDARNTREGIDDEDEDLVVTQAGGAGGHQPPNSKCAISGIAVEAIEDPVEDEKGYVYEKAAIEQYVRSHTGRGRGDTCSCPHAGTSHQISMQSLRPAKNFTRWRKVQARVAASRRASEGGDDDEDVVLTSP